MIIYVLKYSKKAIISPRSVLFMIKSPVNLDDIKKRITELKGSPVKMEINRGRNKIVKFDGVIESVYPSVFTVKAQEMSFASKTFSYFDVLCGDVKITQF